jgi:hypothetical protein
VVTFKIVDNVLCVKNWRLSILLGFACVKVVSIELGESGKDLHRTRYYL